MPFRNLTAAATMLQPVICFQKNKSQTEIVNNRSTTNSNRFFSNLRFHAQTADGSTVKWISLKFSKFRCVTLDRSKSKMDFAEISKVLCNVRQWGLKWISLKFSRFHRYYKLRPENATSLYPQALREVLYKMDSTENRNIFVSNLDHLPRGSAWRAGGPFQPPAGYHK